jgi:hypothetical protein
MVRTALYLKVEVEHNPHEAPEQLAQEMCQRLLKMLGVRAAELSAFISQPQEGPPANSSA